MKIIHVVNKVTHTSIPVEWAIKQSKTDEVIIASLYDSQAKAQRIIDSLDSSCKVVGCSFSRNPFKGIKILKKSFYDADIVHTHHALSGALARIIASKKINVKIIHTVHANHHSFTKWQNFIIGMTLDKADAIVYNSETTKEGLYEWQRKRIEGIEKVIFNGIDCDRIKRASDEYAKDLFKKYKIQKSDFVLLQVGRLEKVKNPIATANGFIDFCERYPDRANYCKLIFVGDGKEREAVEKMVNGLENVYFTGTINRDQVYSLMNSSDAMIVPSIYEGFCNALFEGAEAGLQLIISDIPVFNELVHNYKSIKKISIDNYNFFSSTLEEVISHKGDRDLELIEYVKNEYSIDRCISEYLNLYSMLAQ